MRAPVFRALIAALLCWVQQLAAKGCTAGVKAELFFWLFVALGLMGALGLLRFRFALRFWERMRHLGYLYVALIIVLAIVSVVTGKRL